MELTGDWIIRVSPTSGQRQGVAHLCETTVKHPEGETYTTRCGKQMLRTTPRGYVIPLDDEPTDPDEVRKCSRCASKPA